MPLLSAITMFYPLVHKLLVGVEKQLEGLMRRFLWKGLGLGESRVMVLVT